MAWTEWVGYLGVPLPAALDEGDEHLRARDAHLEPHPRLQGLREPVKVTYVKEGWETPAVKYIENESTQGTI